MEKLATLFVFAVTTLTVGEAGLSVYNLERTINNITSKINHLYFPENTIKVASWNIAKGSRYRCRDWSDNGWKCRRDAVCSYVKEMQPTIIGFQEVTSRQLDDLIRCLADYRHFAGEKTSPDGLKYNPIFYKKTQSIRGRERIQVTKSGTFWLSGSPDISSKLPSRRRTEPRACTWIKIRFRERSSERAYNRAMFPKQKASNKILYLLKMFTRKNAYQRRRRPRRRRGEKYLWSTFYIANTQLEDNDITVATEQMKILQSHIRNTRNMMDRRRYPIIFMGDLRATDSTSVYQAIDDSGWLIDTRYSKYDFGKADRSKTSYIMQSQFRTLTAATFTDDNRRRHTMQMSDQRPLFAMLLTNTTPTKTDETSNDSRRNWKRSAPG